MTKVDHKLGLVHKKHFKKFSKREAGFTLIELLVVVAIISLITSVILVSFSKARMKARESRRVQDARQLITALNLYFDAHAKYPCYGWTTSGMGDSFLHELVDEGFLTKSPKDPLNRGTLIYQYASFKTVAGGPCGQIMELNMNIENPGEICPMGSVPVAIETGNTGHCHIFYPTPLPCSNPQNVPEPPWITHPDCDGLWDNYP